MAAAANLILCVCSVSVAHTVILASASSFEPVADTGLGTFRGKIEYSRSNSKPVYSFLGIPYAEAPTRFEAPVPLVAYWSGVRDAVHFKSHCMQDLRQGKLRLSKLGLTYPHDTISEDCLYLNVYTPSVPSSPVTATPDALDEILFGTSPYPVIVYLHGGNFVMWSGSMFSPIALVAEQKVVVVTVNYRLGPFGFLCVGKAANVGLLDQIEALKWIQNNIHAFHGDPSRVTLMGFSAGAASVGLHLLSPLSRGLFHRAILQGGSGLSVKAVTNHPEVAVNELAASINCSGLPSPTALLGCLKKVDAVLLANHRPKSVHDTWKPCVDGRVLPAHPQMLYSQGLVNRAAAQLMMGFAELEAFTWLNDETDGDYDESDFNETLQSYFRGPQIFSEHALSRLVSEARAAYISGHSDNDEYDSEEEHSDGAAQRASAANVYRAAAMDIISDYLITAPMIKTAELHSLMDADVYVYDFAYLASYHGRPTGRPGYFSSTHGDDAVPALGLVFEASFRLGPADDGDKKLSRRFMSAIGCFARSGNPNSPTLQGHIWPRFLADSRQYVRVADSSSWHPHGLLRAELQPFWDSYLFGVINGASATTLPVTEAPLPATASQAGSEYPARQTASAQSHSSVSVEENRHHLKPDDKRDFLPPMNPTDAPDSAMPVTTDASASPDASMAVTALPGSSRNPAEATATDATTPSSASIPQIDTEPDDHSATHHGERDEL